MEREPLIGPKAAALLNLVAPGVGLGLQRQPLGWLVCATAGTVLWLSGFFDFFALGAYAVAGVGTAVVSLLRGRGPTRSG